MCGHSFTPARKDHALGTPVRWNGRARFSLSAYTNGENALADLAVSIRQVGSVATNAIEK
jgi:hypothetical protein